MEISEQELRGMIRDAIARHAGSGPARAVSPSAPSAQATVRGHASHGLLPLVAGGGDECIIEPARPCDHCGYCKSLGH
jgi:hypothetical protein